MDDFRNIFYRLLILFIVGITVFVGLVYFWSCGFSPNCLRGMTSAQGTPVPTLAPATLPAPDFQAGGQAVKRCRIAAVDLIGAWVTAGFPETEPFSFSDVDGLACEGTFNTDVLPLFTESNIWYPGSLACASCHNADMSVSSAQLDNSSYAGLLAGSRRESQEATGNDVLGGGDWEASLMYDVLFVRKYMPLGRPPDVPAEGPVIFAGLTIQDSSSTGATTP